MRTLFARTAAVLAATFALAFPAAASTNYSTDWTDLWYVPAESGWGVNIAQNGRNIFLVLYVYGGDQLPRWYVASGMTPSSPNNWSGPLYRTVGTPFNAPWNPTQQPPIEVGTATLNFTSVNTATLTYSVDGITVTKGISRINLPPDGFTGPHQGGLLATGSSCGNSSTDYYVVRRLTVAQPTSTTLRFTVDFVTANGALSACVFQGTYTQQGRMGTITDGGWGCSGGANNTGTFVMTEIQGSQNGITAKFSGRDQYCQSINGFFGGLRDVQ